MTGSVRFPAAEVQRHAAAVAEASEQITQARRAVHEVVMDNDAYGVLCQFLPGILSPIFGSALDVLDEAADALRETADKLHTTVAATEGADFDTARRVRATGPPALELPL